MYPWVQGLGFGVWGFGVWGLGFGDLLWVLGFGVLRFGVWGLIKVGEGGVELLVAVCRVRSRRYRLMGFRIVECWV